MKKRFKILLMLIIAVVMNLVFAVEGLAWRYYQDDDGNNKDTSKYQFSYYDLVQSRIYNGDKLTGGSNLRYTNDFYCMDPDAHLYKTYSYNGKFTKTEPADSPPDKDENMETAQYLSDPYFVYMVNKSKNDDDWKKALQIYFWNNSDAGLDKLHAERLGYDTVEDATDALDEKIKKAEEESDKRVVYDMKIECEPAAIKRKGIQEGGSFKFYVNKMSNSRPIERAPTSTDNDGTFITYTDNVRITYYKEENGKYLYNAQVIGTGVIKIEVTHKYEEEYVVYNKYVSSKANIQPIAEPYIKTVPLECDDIITIKIIKPRVTINNYIENITYKDGTTNKVQYFKSNKLQLNNANNSRIDWSESLKNKYPALLENGCEVTYKVVVENETSDNSVWIRFEDTLPDCFKGSTITIRNERWGDNANNTEVIEDFGGTIYAKDWPVLWNKNDVEHDDGNIKLRGTNQSDQDDITSEITFTITATVNASNETQLEDKKESIARITYLSTIPYITKTASGRMQFKSNDILNSESILESNLETWLKGESKTRLLTECFPNKISFKSNWFIGMTDLDRQMTLVRGPEGVGGAIKKERRIEVSEKVKESNSTYPQYVMNYTDDAQWNAFFAYTYDFPSRPKGLTEDEFNSIIKKLDNNELNSMIDECNYEQLKSIVGNLTDTELNRIIEKYNNYNNSGNIDNLNASDYFIIKKYNITINSYISNFTRADNSNIKTKDMNGYYINASGRYINEDGKALSTEEEPVEVDDNIINEEMLVVDNNIDNIGVKRAKLTNTKKTNSPIFIENGDILTYKVDLKRVNKTSKPHYSYKNVIATVECTLPLSKGYKIINEESIKGIVANYDCTGDKITFDIIVNKDTKSINIKFKTNSTDNVYEYNTLNKLTARIVKIKNCNDKIIEYNVDGTIMEYNEDGTKKDNPQIINNGKKLVSSDNFRVKEYNVVLDSYITQVNHTGNDSIIYNDSTARKSDIAVNDDEDTNNDDNNKKNNPVWIESGDIVTYKLRIYNTTENESIKEYNLGNGKRANIPYRKPNTSFVDIKTTLPEGSSSVSANAGTSSITNNTLTLTNIEVPRNGVKEVTITFKLTAFNNSDMSAKKVTSKIVDVRNINKYQSNTEGSTEVVRYKVKNNGQRTSSSDYIKIKEYNVVIDNYITNVTHQESREGVTTTYNSDNSDDGRKSKITVADGKGTKDSTKENPVYTERGDKITYKIRIYNTTNKSDITEYQLGTPGDGTRGKSPYANPEIIYVDMTDTLPEYYSGLAISGVDTDKYSVSGRTITFTNVLVASNDYTEITVSFIVENVAITAEPVNTVKIDDITNINDCKITNHGKRTTASDKYKMSEYKATLTEYISSYNAEMLTYNNSKGFTNNEAKVFEIGKYTEENPLPVEKYETLTFTTKVTNDVKTKDTNNTKEEENVTNSYKKYYTRVRPTTVTQILDEGLERTSTNLKVEWYHASDNTTDDISSNVSVTQDNNNSNKYIYTINDDDIILSPGDYILYTLSVEVTKSNMYLGTIKSYSEITELSNVNRNLEKDIPKENSHGIYNDGDEVKKCQRIVTSVNTVEDTEKYSSDYVKLKDLIIAGTVWWDQNKNGLNDNTDGIGGMKDITVRLFRSGGQEITTKTNDKGLYTFERQAKADSSGKYYDYYVEFEYDGIMYRPAEWYGGTDSNKEDGKIVDNYGRQNLDATIEIDGNESKGGRYWRQGYDGLPGKKSGSEAYKIDSNAYEFDNVRIQFNEKHKTIGYNNSYGKKENEEVKTEMTYSKSGHVSILNESNDPNRIMTARSFIKQNYGETVNESVGNTNMLFLYDHKADQHNLYPETEYLKFINLGLVKRETIDMSIEADVKSVTTTINGEEMTYEFGTKTADSNANDYHEKVAGTDNAYKFNEPYNFKIYESDYNYRYDKNYNDDVVQTYQNIASELNIDVTYRIKIHNNNVENGATILSAINEMAIYYDADFMEYKDATSTVTVKDKDAKTGLLVDKSKEVIRTKYEEKKSIDIKTESKYGANRPQYNETGYGYKVVYLSGMSNDYIEEGGERYIDITFTVDKAKIDDVERTLKIANELKIIPEISAYTTKYSSNYKRKGLQGQYAAMVDHDSNPGNLDKTEVSKYEVYEDDTYEASIKIVTIPNTEDSRTITGIVWEDERVLEINYDNTGKQLVGDGKKDSSDKIIEGVKVSLIEIVQTESGKYYEQPAKIKDSNGNWKYIYDITDEEGKYTLSGFVPGYYKVRFDYGYDSTRQDNLDYNGQDYKSTTYYSEGWYYEANEKYKTDDIGSSYNYAYFDDVKTKLSNPATTFSDAQDDEIRRLNVNSYSETMTSTEAKVFYDKEAENLTKYTKMFAESTIFYVKPENVESEIKNINAKNANFNNTRIWRLNNIDFGLEYRPEVSLTLDKKIASIELITSDNKSLAKIYFKDQDGQRIVDTGKSKGHENVQFLPNKEKETQGFVYINIDTDILEGCTVKVEYEMEAQNQSEIDRINKNLDEIRYEKGAIDKSYKEKIYNNGNYSANGTAAQLLASKYYEGYGFNTGSWSESYKYLKKLKKPYKSTGDTDINEAKNTKLAGTEYYGMYLGQAYYTGNVGINDVVTTVKVDHILDYVDNDFTFSLSENKTKNKSWKTTTSEELKNMLDFEKVADDNPNGKGNLIDKNGIRYDTSKRSNLALSVNDNKNGKYGDPEDNANPGNALLSRFLEISEKGKISLATSKVLSADDVAEGTELNYENIAEIIQYTTLTGRKTKFPNDNGGGSVIGNANVENWTGYDKYEDDTDATEIITIAPPTGLTK